MKYNLYWIMFFLIIACSTNIIDKSDKKEQTDKSKVNSHAVNTNYGKMLIGAWEMDSLKIEGKVNKNGRWIEIYNQDSTFCFLSDKSIGDSCKYAKNGVVSLYGVKSDTLFHYDFNRDTSKAQSKDKYKKIIKLTESVFIYKIIGINQEAIYYYHRIR